MLCIKSFCPLSKRNELFYYKKINVFFWENITTSEREEVTAKATKWMWIFYILILCFKICIDLS